MNIYKPLPTFPREAVLLPEEDYTFDKTRQDKEVCGGLWWFAVVCGNSTDRYHLPMDQTYFDSPSLIDLRKMSPKS